MKYIREFNEYEPNKSSVTDLERYLDVRYEIIDYRGDKLIVIDDKPFYLTGFQFNKGRLTDKIFYDVTLDVMDLHQPSLRRAIKNWIDKHHMLKESHLQKSGINLSIELENKLRRLEDDSKLTVNDFVSNFGIDPKHMTDFAWASILKNTQKYKNMSDEEFEKVYNEYKSNITEDEEDDTFEEDDYFDLDFAIGKIKEEFDEDKVVQMFDEEVLEWVDSDWEDDYESEYDWYVDHNNGEAQDSVITQIINWYKKEFDKTLSIDEHSELFDSIKSEYDCLNY